jgi:hypothetical protein
MGTGEPRAPAILPSHLLLSNPAMIPWELTARASPNVPLTGSGVHAPSA